MFITGKYNTAVVYAAAVDRYSEDQVRYYLDHPAFSESRVRVMPDVHVGSGTVVGFTATLTDKILPHLIGVDIGCGVSAWNLGKGKLKADKLDKFIRKHVPSGYAVSKEITDREECETAFETLPDTCTGFSFPEFWQQLHRICEDQRKNPDHVLRSIGTLGGGNHFIEVGKDQDKNLWLIIHSGSRNFGFSKAEFHQEIAVAGTRADSSLKYLEGEKARRYLEDMKMAQDYARLNRKVMGTVICRKFFKQKEPGLEWVESVHNYISFADNIVRKGAISAHKGERVIIPFSMAEGAVIGYGKGNREWNFSAPHGAGRKMSRKKARESLNLELYRKAMRGIWTSCIAKNTLDESPMAYKKAADILEAIHDTIEVEKRLMPVYNFKAAG
jgi:RNA-splicing ligase RtcB